MSDVGDDLQRTADFFVVDLGDRPPGPPKWLTDMYDALAAEHLEIVCNLWLPLTPPHVENRRLPLRLCDV